MVRYSFSLMKGDRLSFSSHLKCHQKGTHLWVAAVTSLTIGIEMLAFVFYNWLEICFFMVPSIQGARLLAYCVLIGSLAELSFNFCRRSVLAFLQMVDAITGKVISSMVIILALRVHCDTYLFHGFTPRTRSCSGLLSLLYWFASGSD
jgi:hypothetical protein